jgi:putative hydrolase of the HAD superfamily
MSRDVSREFWIWVYQTFLEQLGRHTEARTDLPERMLETFLRLENYSLYDDALPVLDRLHRAGMKLGVISNWEEWLERLIVHLEIGHYFDVLAVSGTFGAEKPEAAIFRYALEAADALPEHAVHVGDSFGDDVLGAASVGIRPILLDRENRGFPLLPSQEGELPEPLARVRSLLEVPRLLGLE